MTSTQQLTASVIQISAANPSEGRVSELALSPITMLGLGQNTNTCMVHDATTGLESVISIFSGWQINNAECQKLKTGELLKLIKESVPELNSIHCPDIDGIIPGTIAKQIFDNIKYSVDTCTAPSRFINKCYLSGEFFEDENMTKGIITRLYSGGKELYGLYCYRLTIQFHKSLEFLWPVADMYFNVVNRLIPLTTTYPALLNLANSENYLLCKFKNQVGNIQQGFIKLTEFSMLQFNQEAPYEPYISIFYNSSGNDINTSQKIPDMYSSDVPEHDSNESCKLADIISYNPDLSNIFREDNDDIKFEKLMCELMTRLCRNEQF